MQYNLYEINVFVLHYFSREKQFPRSVISLTPQKYKKQRTNILTEIRSSEQLKSLKCQITMIQLFMTFQIMLSKAKIRNKSVIFKISMRLRILICSVLWFEDKQYWYIIKNIERDIIFIFFQSGDSLPKSFVQLQFAYLTKVEWHFKKL